MKGLFNKILILILVFAAAIGIFLFVNRDKNVKENVTMGDPTLPTISLMAAAGEGQDGALEINQLYGYTSEMETKYMRDSITPISSARKLTIKVQNFDNKIMGAWFELRSLDCERLIEKTDVKTEDISEDGDYTNITITFENMIDADTEYNLVLCLNTDRHEEVYYYTRVIELTENHLTEQMNFVQQFSQGTYDDGLTLPVGNYIEPDANQDNSNLGHVTINSSYKQITWGNLSPEKVTTPVIKVYEILGDVGCFEMNYVVKAKNDYDVDQYYIVNEYYRVKYSATDIYLLNYDRTMRQMFEANNQNISTMRINLGITDDDDQCSFMASDSTKYIAFARDNGLWLMDIKNNQTKALYTFQNLGDGDIRDGHIENDINIVSVDDSGNTEFIVYGYMNRGEHEGMVGVSLYSYNAKKNIVKEKIFIPFTRNYNMLKETVGKLTYVNKDNVVFLMLNNSIYSIDLTGSEYVEIISNLTDDKYVINDSGNAIAWESDGENSGSSTIKILDFDTGEEKEIVADKGTKLKVVGFLNDDFCYGVANESDIVSDSSGNVTIAMNDIRIIDSEAKLVKEYNKSGYYFVSATVDGNMINMTRVTKAADGNNFVKADEYQIFGNEEEDTSVVTASTITTDTKQIEQVINFVTKVTTSKKFKNVYPKEIVFTDTNSMGIKELIANDDNYYVYANGKISLISDNISEAVNDAYQESGVVIGNDGDYVWAKCSRDTQFEISGINIASPSADDTNSRLATCISSMLSYNGVNIDVAAQLQAGKTALEILKENLPDREILDFEDCTLNEMLYYVAKGCPVLTQSANGKYVIITGYDFYNVVMLDPVSGATYKQGQEEAQAVYESLGGKFIVVNK